MPEQASRFAMEVDLFYIALWLLTIGVSIGIVVAIFLFMVKYKRRHNGEIPEQIEGAMVLEITWSVVPLIICIGIFAWGAKLYYQMYSAPKESLEIFVTGKQWMWRAQHPDGSHQTRNVSSVLHGILRHAAFGHDWICDGVGTVRIPALAERCNERTSGGCWRTTVFQSGLQHLPFA